MLQGEVKSKERPVNSLLDHDLNFKLNVKSTQLVQQDANPNSLLEDLIRQRILDELFDDRVRYLPSFAGEKRPNQVSTEKSTKGLAELYELEFKDYLGLGDNKLDRLKKEIMEGFKEINCHLDELSNFHYVPKMNIYTQRVGGDAGIQVEEKIPTTMIGVDNGILSVRSASKSDFEASKETNKKSLRVRNKRIARQRKKEQFQNKTKKRIEYGGITKHQAQVNKKILKNQRSYGKDQGDIPVSKYNKSNQFFRKIEANTEKKPYKPIRLSKMKI